MRKIKKITVAAIQIDCNLANKSENFKKINYYIRKAVSQNVKLIVLPELFNTGYRTESIDFELSETIPGETTKKLINTSAKHNIYLTGTILERDLINGVVYNTAVLIGPEGVIGKYRKTHLWNQEKIRFSPGNQIITFKTELGIIGLQICYEIGYPEISRKLTLQGAEIIICSSAFGKQRNYIWDVATRSRAIENGVFLIACNRCGKDKSTEFAGHSRIVNPKGELIQHLTNEEGMIISEINLNDILKQRINVPYLRDMNTNLYKTNNLN